MKQTLVLGKISEFVERKSHSEFAIFFCNLILFKDEEQQCLRNIL